MMSLRGKGAAPAQPVRPVGETGKELISVRALLEWAFGVECARLEDDKLVVWSERSATAVVCDQLALSPDGDCCVRIDGGGRSWPHDDAEIVADVLRHSVRWPLALRVAELARVGRAEDWGQSIRPRVEPREWQMTRHGPHGKARRLRRESYVERGRVRQFDVRIVDVTYYGTAREIAAARRRYLDWWGALLSVMAGLGGVELKRFELTARMPPMEPWREKC